jgi:anti-sigma28 factor (negative regulator of flagellin synthesis)
MSINGISGYSSVADAYSTYTTKTKATDAETSAKTTTATKTETTAETGVIYESSASSTEKTYTQDTNLVAQLKADAEERTAQLQNLVREMLLKQGNTYHEANNLWKFLSSGDYTVPQAVREKAQTDIAENGYWGVDQTSDRIIDMAKALTGGDPDKIEEMKAAFEKGFKEATKAWGKDLPSISSDTYDAVMKKFDTWAEEAAQI